VTWQRYTDPVAVARLKAARCPECGHGIGMHDGWGGPDGCTLTDTGVAGRIHQFNQDQEGRLTL
jgi:hypothetical protein